MKTGQEILDAYNNQDEQSFIDGDFSCLNEMIDEELNAIIEQRDELLAALREIANLPRENLMQYHRIADKAIANATK